MKPIVTEEIYHQLNELSSYNNPNLTSKSILIFQRVFKSNNLKMERFYEELFICGEERVNFAIYLEKHRAKFFTLEDTNTPFVNF